MSRLEDTMNFLTDQEWGWCPFLFLRPRKDQDIDNAVLLKMACCFGPVAGLVALLPLFLFRHGVTAREVILCLVGASILFFLAYKWTFAIFWNRRAERLRSSNAQPASET